MEDWTRFKRRIVIEKPIRTIYDCWSTRHHMEKWFLEKAIYTGKGDQQRKMDENVQAGDTFEWKWNNWDFTESGTILSANGKDAISFTFGEGGKVHVTLKAIGEATEINLTQEEIPSDEKSKQEIFVGCATGWTFWLANLKAYLEHGITLHAKGLRQEETTDLVNS